MRIGELSQATGVTARMLRYYEEQGLITPHRGDNGYREYDEDLLDRVRRIRDLSDSGIPLRLIGDLLPCLGRPQDVAVDPELREVLVRARDRMGECAARLHQHHEALTRYIEMMDGAEPSEMVPRA